MKYGTYADLENSLSGKKMFGKEDCPFCQDIVNDTLGRILWQGASWVVVYNRYPYVLGGKHIMLVPRRHVRLLSEITSEEWKDKIDAEKFLFDYFDGEEYFSFTRESYGHRSVEHVHTHYISGKIPRQTLSDMLVSQGYKENI